MTAVILCGGLGTRLRSVLDDRPKCLAPVLGRTYLDILTDYLHGQGVDSFVFATGHMHDQVEAWVASQARPWTSAVSREEAPLGTGGALRLAAEKVREDDFLAFNGDTFIEVDCRALMARRREADVPIALVAVQVADTSAFGRIDVADGFVGAFREKGVPGPGLINGGAYAVSKRLFDGAASGAFSLERDVLMKPGLRPAAVVATGEFLDIGTPENLLKAGQVAARFGSQAPRT